MEGASARLDVVSSSIVDEHGLLYLQAVLYCFLGEAEASTVYMYGRERRGRGDRDCVPRPLLAWAWPPSLWPRCARRAVLYRLLCTSHT